MDSRAHRSTVPPGGRPAHTQGMNDNAIRIRGLRRQYAGAPRPAVDGIDLDVHRGEIFSLLGPNGAGKTTTVEILEGHRGRDSGEVSVLGADPGRAGRGWRAAAVTVARDRGLL